MIFHNLDEGVRIALDALRTNKLRSALTILGVVIGVTTVMAMASIVQGVRSQIFNTIEVAGPTTFYVMRFFSQTPLNPDNLPYEVRIRPVLDRDDLEAVERVSTRSATAGLWIQLFERLEYRGVQDPDHDRIRRGRPLHGHPGRHAPSRALLLARRAGGARRWWYSRRWPPSGCSAAATRSARSSGLAARR